MTKIAEVKEFQLPKDFKDLWGSLWTEELRSACNAYCRFGDSITKDDKRGVISRLAALIHFREKTLRGWSPEKLGDSLFKHIEHKTLRKYHDNIIRSWLLYDHLSVITGFLDAVGIPHKKGMLETDSPNVASETSFRRGLIKCMKSQPTRPLAIYLAYNLILRDDSWSNLRCATIGLKFDITSILEQSGPDVEETTSCEEEEDPIPESNQSFTTLDNLIIRTIVAAAVEEVGSHTLDELDDLVNEFVDLNVTRHHSYLVEITRTGPLAKLVWAPRKDPDHEGQKIHHRTKDPHTAPGRAGRHHHPGRVR